MRKYYQLAEKAHLDIYTKELVRCLMMINLDLVAITHYFDLDDALGESFRDVPKLINNPSANKTVLSMYDSFEDARKYLKLVIGKNFASFFYDKADDLIKRIYLNFNELKRIGKNKPTEIKFQIEKILIKIASFMNDLVDEYNQATISFDITTNRRMNYYFEIN